MSFINKAKNEVADTSLGDKKNIIAELSAIVNAIGKVSKKDGIFSLVIETEIQNLPPRLDQMCQTLYSKQPTIIEFEDSTFTTVKKYRVEFDNQIVKQLLLDCHLIREKSFGNYDFVDGISRHVVEDENAIKSYIRGIFLACASANIKIDDINQVKKHRGGYHLEFVFSKQNLSKDFVHLMTTFSFNLKIIPRKNSFVCYIKEMELISDILAIVGANQAVLMLQNELALRNVRNNLNRQLNCMNANISKTIDASLKQLQAINLIDATVGIETLPDSLLDLCLLRLANPEENFEELRQLSNPQLTKSCINHRFRKIMEIANEIKSKQGSSNEDE